MANENDNTVSANIVPVSQAINPNYIYGTPYVQQGWQCPTCNRVYSPSMIMCMYCGNPNTVTTTTPNTGTPITHKPKIS